MRLASVLLPASAVTAFLLVGGAVVYVQAGTMPADSVVWAEVAGDGTVFPACGSASIVGSPTCSGDGTAQVTLSWEVQGVHPDPDYGSVMGCTEVRLYGGPGGTIGGLPCTHSGYIVNGLAPNTTYNFEVRGVSSGAETRHDIIHITVTTPNCTPPIAPTVSLTANGQSPSLTINQGDNYALYRNASNYTSCALTNTRTDGYPIDPTENYPPSNLPLTTDTGLLGTYTLACQGPGGTASASVTIDARPPTLTPDLTASAVAPATATAGTATTFSATISNANAATGVQFKNLFQRATDASGTGATDIITTAFQGPLSAGASLTASGSYTFTTAGTYYLRACADKDWSGGGGWVAESDETNNCGPWTAVVVSAPSATIQGNKVLMPGNQISDTVGGQTVTVSGVGSSAANPYFISVTSGQTYTVSVPSLSGYTIGYTLCIDRIDCHTGTPTVGTSVSVAIPSGANHYADLWWHYTPPPSGIPTLTASCDASTHVATMSWTAVSDATSYWLDVHDTTFPWVGCGSQGNWCFQDITTLSYTMTGLFGNYTAKVRACNASGCGSPTSLVPFSCIATARPDLTAGTVSPTTAVAGTATTFSATISNANVATGASFTNLFQRATDANGTGATDIGTDTSPTLGAGETDTARLNYTPTTAGTFYMRVCADKSSAASTGTITESNETNNCGPWTAVVVSTTPSPVSGTCSVSPTSIVSGGSATWSAVPSGGTGTYTYSWTGTDSLTGTTQNVTKTYSTAGTKTASVTITSGGVSSTIACSNNLTVTDTTARPDLTTSAVLPTSAPVNTTTTFWATVTNGGSASTGASFTNLFQRDNDSDHTSGVTDIGTDTSPSLAALGTDATTFSYTFTSTGTFYMRVCADKSSAASTGTITESNETNNCGPWTAITVGTTSQDPLGYFDGASCSILYGWAYDPKASATSISVHLYDGSTFIGGRTTDELRADVNNAYGITGDHGISMATPARFKDGAAHTLHVYAINTNGTGPNPELQNSPKAITCTPPSQPDLTAGNVQPRTAYVGEDTNLTAVITNTGTATPAGLIFTDGFQIDTDTNHDSGNEVYGTDPNNPPLNPDGTYMAHYIYRFPAAGAYFVRACADKRNQNDTNGLVAESDEGNNCSHAWVQVTVVDSPPPPPTSPTATLSTNPSTVDSGEACSLFWSSTNATSCTGVGFSTGGAIANPPGGVSTGALTITTNYQMTCTGAGGTSAPAVATCTVNQPEVEISADPERVITGGISTIIWSSTNTGPCIESGPGLSSNTNSGSQSVVVTGQQIYTITCESLDGGTTKTKSAVVNATSQFQEF